MKELRIVFATACLIYLAGFTFTASASEHEHEEDDDKYEIRRGTDSIESDHRSESTRERLKKQREKEKERLEKLREKQKKLREAQKERLEKLKKKKNPPITGSGATVPGTGSGNTNTGTTNTGTTNTGTTAPVTKSRTVSYGTPDGSVNIGFSVTITNGIITAASSTTIVGGTSGAYQNIFAAGLSQAVVGKRAAGLNISAIGGASLTTTAFENFVAQ